MPLDKKKLMSHLTAASKAKAPATPAKAAEKIEQDVKKATGVSKVEKEAEQATKASHTTLDVRQIAELSLSRALMRKLLSGEKLSTDDQKAVAAVCRQVGFL